MSGKLSLLRLPRRLFHGKPPRVHYHQGSPRNSSSSFQSHHHHRHFHTSPRSRYEAREPATPLFLQRSAAFLRWSAVLGGVSLFAVYATDSRNACLDTLVLPAMRLLLDAEQSHQLAILLGKLGWTPRDSGTDDECLKGQFLGIPIDNPVGLAAGFDKNAEAIDSLFGMGFGLVEIGSVTPLPQSGNPRPRMFRLEKDGAVINRYGFNSDGMDVVHGRLKVRECAKGNKEATAMLPKSLLAGHALGINLGKNKLSAGDSNQDYVWGIRELGHFADYLVVNISSPNTPGLRQLQKKEILDRLVGEVVETRDQLPMERKPPLLVKIAPDLSQEELEAIAEIVQRRKVDGVIISNTTVQRSKHLRSVVTETGGLSGKPLKPLSLKMVAQFHQLTKGQVPIVGCGGIASGEDALAFMEAGATVVQFYTALAYQGPGLVREIKDHLTAHCKKKKLGHISQVIGCRAEELSK